MYRHHFIFPVLNHVLPYRQPSFALVRFQNYYLLYTLVKSQNSHSFLSRGTTVMFPASSCNTTSPSSFPLPLPQTKATQFLPQIINQPSTAACPALPFVLLPGPSSSFFPFSSSLSRPHPRPPPFFHPPTTLFGLLPIERTNAPQYPRMVLPISSSSSLLPSSFPPPPHGVNLCFAHTYGSSFPR